MYVPAGLRLLWLMIVVGSAVVATEYVLSPYGVPLSQFECAVIVIYAASTVMVTWRQQRQQLRGWRASSIIAFWAAVSGALMSYPALAPRRPMTQADIDYFCMRAAIRRRDLPAVRGLLRRGLDPAYTSYYSVRADDPDFFSKDLAPSNEALADSAIRAGSVDIARTVIHAEVSRDGQGVFAGDPLVEAVRCENAIPMLKLLLHSGVPINDYNYDCAALWLATTRNEVRTVNVLLGAGANPNTRGDVQLSLQAPDGRMSVVHKARLLGYSDIVMALKHDGAAD